MEYQLNPDNFEAEVLKADGVVLVDFYADWCGPCKMLAPIIEEVAGLYPALKVCKVNVDHAMPIAERYGIRSIPTLIFFRAGEPCKVLVGYRTLDELKPEVEALL